MEENKVLNEMEMETTEMEQVNNDWVVDSEEETTESSGLGKIALVATIAGAVVAGGIFAAKKIRGHFAKKHEAESHEVPDIKVTEVEVEEADE